MALLSTTPTTRRGYLSQAELAQYANITIVDAVEADDQISQAEEIIDAYVRQSEKFVRVSITGTATGGTTTTLIDTQNLTQYDGYYNGLELEILAGIGVGKRLRITGSDKATKTITFTPALEASIDTTSVYEIYQLGLFPRHKDVLYTNDTYYKRIPEAVKRATAAQVEYIIEKGEAYFKGGAEFKSESIGDYSYTRDSGSITALLAPKARLLLKGYVNRTGQR